VSIFLAAIDFYEYYVYNLTKLKHKNMKDGNKIGEFRLNILPRESMSWDKFVSSTPENSIALDGVVLGGPRFDMDTNHFNFDHHDGVIREVTMSTCMQVYFAIKGGIMNSLLPKKDLYGVVANIYINDTDQDTSFAVWLIKNHEKFEGTQSIPHINRLLSLTDRWDITGGAFPMNIADDLVRQHTWVFEPYTKLRKSGKLSQADSDIMFDNLMSVMGRLNVFLMGQSGESKLDIRHRILYDSPVFKIVDEVGGNEARYYLYGKGMNSFLSLVAKKPDGRFVYSLGRRSQFINFPVEKLYEDFNRAEGLTKDNGWGGSNIIGGSPRGNGSSLSWENLRDIINERLKKEGLL